MICEDCEGRGYLSDYCSQCNGSGEGLHDGSSCSVCKGSGVEKLECKLCKGLGEISLDDFPEYLADGLPMEFFEELMEDFLAHAPMPPKYRTQVEKVWLEYLQVRRNREWV